MSALSILFIVFIIQVIFCIINPKVKSHKFYALICLAFFIEFVFISFFPLHVVHSQTKKILVLTSIGACIYIMIHSVLEFLDYSKSYNNIVRLSHELTDINNGLLEVVETKTKHLQKANDELSKINKQQKFLISIISTDLTYIFKKIKTVYSTQIKTPVNTDSYIQDLIKIRTASEKGSQIINNVMDWTRSQTPFNPEKRVITDLSTLVNDIKHFFFDQLENKKITLQTDIDNSLIFSCDISHLNIILRNLISNAIKYSYLSSKIEIMNMEKDGKVLIKVTDHGMCIPTDKIPDIFDSDKSKRRVGTSGEKGSGFGLIIVKELVKINNGMITCTSENGIGTTFSIQFNQ
jgi:signal transduction histidine kinase